MLPDQSTALFSTSPCIKTNKLASWSKNQPNIIEVYTWLTRRKKKKTNQSLGTKKENKISGDMITCNDGHKAI
jgi:hypothetical protein